MEIHSYLSQIIEASVSYGVPLEDAVEAEGIAATTLWRWQNKAAEPKYATARALIRRMRIMTRGQQPEKVA